jgi:hypothetical protein
MPPEDFDALDSMSRDELVARARALGAKRPEVMTRVELRDEIIRLSEPDAAAQRRSRGWLGVARDLVASVVESGLNMRDAAAAIRGDQRSEQEWLGPPPVATVTLAEIYVAQGHPERALGILDEVLAREPDHPAANALRERIIDQQSAKGERKRARAPETTSPEAESDASDEAPMAMRQPFVTGVPEIHEPEVSLPAPAEEARPEESPPDLTPVSAEARVAPVPEAPVAVPVVEPAPHVEPPPAAKSASGAEPAPLAEPPAVEPSPATEQRPSLEPGPREPHAAMPPVPDTLSVAFDEEVPSSPISNYEPVPSSESPFSTMNPERTILDYAVEEPAERRECVLVREGRSLRAYWEVFPAPAPLVLRVAAFVPRSRAPEQIMREIRLDQAEGAIPIEGIPEKSIVRAALGCREGDAFVPLVVAAVIEGELGGAKRSVYRPPGQPAGALEQELSTPTI